MRNIKRYIKNLGILLFFIITLGLIHLSKSQVVEEWMYFFGKGVIGFMLIFMMLTEFVKAKLSQVKERKYHIINGILLFIIVAFEVIEYYYSLYFV